LGPGNRAVVRWVSLAAVLLNLAVTGVLAIRAAPILAAKGAEIPGIMLKDDVRTFEPIWVPGDPAATHATKWALLEIPVGGGKDTPAVQFYIGLDGLNLWLLVLTSLLMVPSVLISWNSIRERSNEFYAWLLVLQ